MDAATLDQIGRLLDAVARLITSGRAAGRIASVSVRYGIEVGTRLATEAAEKADSRPDLHLVDDDE